MHLRKGAFFFMCLLACLLASQGAMAAGIMPAQGLSARQKAIVPIAAFTAKGDVPGLKKALAKGLDNGLSISEAKEILIQMYAYAGFPRSLTALDTFMGLLDERKAQGINDEPGREATPLSDTASKRELGAKNQTAVVGRPVSGRVYEFAPVIDAFLKEHLFGDIFGRDILDFQERELATAAALASLPAEPQLRSHLQCALVVGLTEKQLQELISVLESEVGAAEGNLAKKSLQSVLENKSK